MSGSDAAKLAHSVGAKLVVPCHYDMFAFNTADPAEQFVPECERLGQPCKVLALGESVTLGAGS
jgi:L-ascorbate metabolism protein UlaG (beta-lactamase superfamily)